MGRLIVQPYGGLCNRLRAVVSASLLAEKLGREFQVDWIPDPATCGCVPSDLFRAFPGATASPSVAPFVSVDRESDLREVVRVSEGEDIRIRTQADLRPAGPDQVLESEFVRRLRTLEPHPAISARVPALPQGTIGLHVRRGDHWPSTRYSPLHLFHRAIEESGSAAGGMSLFLATDSPEVRASMGRRYGARLLHATENTPSRGSASGVADALVDLLTLSRTQVILGSVLSSFSVTASRWGGTPLRILRLPGSPPGFGGTAMDRLHLRFLQFDPDTARWRPRTARTWPGRAAFRFLSPWLLRRAAIATSDDYQEGRTRLRY